MDDDKKQKESVSKKILKKIKTFSKKVIFKLKIFLKDHFFLVFKSAAENHLRIQHIKVKPEEGEICNLSFNSYSDLKRYQKKVRIFTYSFSSTVAAVLVVVMFAQIFFPGHGHGATYTFAQSSWTGGATANNAAHPDDSTGWNEYSSKDAQTAAGSDIKLAATSASQSQTSDTDFNAGTLTDVSVSGTGDNASLNLGGASGFSGGTITTDGVYNIHSFTSNGTFVTPVPLQAEVLVVAGGGGGGGSYSGGGGGGGGLIYNSGYSISSGSNSVVVGSGGNGGTNGAVGSNGGSSSFGSLLAVGGGGGGTYGINGSNGGSGGGSGGWNGYTPGASIIGQGNQGGAYFTNGTVNGAGGGGGAGNIGGSGAVSGGGNGGDGLQYSISGTSVYYSGGGGGASYVANPAAATPGTGGLGGGGNGGRGGSSAFPPVNATSGGANTGGGGGGTERNGTKTGGNGGSGIVIVRYQKMFNSSGTFLSSIIDAGQKSSFSTLDFNATTPANTALTVDVRAGNTATPDETWTAWQTGISNGSLISFLNGNQYVQYRVNLSTLDPSISPSLNDITFNYQYYPNSGFNKFLLHADGTGNGFTDSATGKTITAIDNTTQSTTAYKFGGKSVYFDGGGDYLSLADSADWDFAGLDFTIDFWEKSVVVDAWDTLLDYGKGTANADSSWYIGFWDDFTIGASFFDTGGGTNTARNSSIVNDGNWHHIAIVRNGGQLKVAVDGQFGSSADVTGKNIRKLSGNDLRIGVMYSGQFYNGYIDELRISKGVARWTSNFTPPVSAYEFPEIFNLTSSPYNAGSVSNVVSKITWTENLPTNTDAKFQIRTSPDNSTWTSWMGPDGTSSTYFTDPTGGEAIPAAISDGSNDKWIQYKTFLTSSDGIYTPTISAVNLQYVVNASPEIQNVTASQGSDGIVSVHYDVRDADTNTGATPNKVNMTLQYCSANCSSAGNETWIDASSVTGNVGANVAVEQSNWSSGYQINWNAKNDFANQYNTTDFKIRVKADDGEGANNIAYGESAALAAFDTKAPVAGASPILIDATTSPATLSLDASDDSALEMKVSLNSDLSGAAWESYSASKTITLSTNPQTVYVQFKDAYNNTTSILSAATPEKPTAMMVQDTSNVNVSPVEYRLFTAWKVSDDPAVGFGSYKVYRSTNQVNWQLVSTIGNRLTNYYGDSNISDDSTFYYKVLTVDADGNTSGYSDIVNGKANGIQDAGEGGGGVGNADPVISGVSSDQITSTSARISWSTDELSDSIVSYQTQTGGNFSNAPARGTLQMADNISGLGKHEVILSGLTPNTQYYFQVTSRDALGGSSSDYQAPNGYSFQTLSSPAVTNISVDQGNENAEISWTTSVSAESFVSYSASILNGALVDPVQISSGGSKTSHSVNLENLTPNTPYYFSISATDSNDGTTVANNTGSFYNFTTTQDTAGPVISSVSVPVITTSNAAITWTTDEGATTQVKYSTTSGGPYTSTTKITVYEQNHSVIIPVSADRKYYYKVYSDDIYGNPSSSSEYNFTSQKEAQYNHDPLGEITFAASNPSVLTDAAAVISFTTDQQANCFVEYGTQTADYSYTPVQEKEDEYNTQHAITLSGLLFNTKYYYKVTCEDNFQDPTVVSSAEKDFTTLEKQYTASDLGISSDTTAPVISNIQVSKITGESVSITWNTSEKASSSVRYGISSLDENGAIESLVNKSVDNYSTDHTVVIHGLIPATKYIFAVLSADGAGNIVESDQDSFSTTAVSTLSSISAESKSLGEAVISWQTDQETTSLVEYGLSTAYGEKKESSSFTKTHSVSLSNLKLGELYHFRVKGKDKNDVYYASSDNTFSPKSPPKIDNISTNEITEHEATVSFESDVPTQAIVAYVNVKNQQDNGSQSENELASNHKVVLKNLSQGTTYSISIAARDESGNETKIAANDITTGVDNTTPKIDQIKTDNALTQSDKVQSIISWRTDEQATTELIYKEGKNGQEKEIKISDALAVNHVAVITTFNPGTVYYFKVKSVDASGNEATSTDFALLTPKRRENIIQIIINNFQQIFGWAKV